MRLFRVTVGLLACSLAAAAFAADDDVRDRRIRFETGRSDATIEGKITGRDAIDYLVGARAGQTLTVRLKTDHTANYFNVIPPDSADEAVFVGSTEGNRYEGRLDLDGDWKLRVYLMRSAARRDETAEFELSVAVTGRPDPSAAREANDFGPREWDARGKLGCARGGQPMQTAACPFKVLRYAEGATIWVLAPGTGAERILYLNDGVWTTAGGETVEVHQRADLWSLVVAEEAYEVPGAVVFGG